jgi:hypothetical protein
MVGEAHPARLRTIMESVIHDSAKIISTLGNLFKREGLTPEFEVLSQGECMIEINGYDNWNGGTDIYSIFCKVPIDIYSKYEHKIPSLEESIKNKAEKLIRVYPHCWINEVVISPVLTSEIHGKAYKITGVELLNALGLQKSLMISVSTGGPDIKLVNHEYKERLKLIDEGLAERNIGNTNPFKDLWDWYGKWSSGELPKWQSRREYISEIFNPLIETVQTAQIKPINPVFEEPTGWTRVDRSVGEIKLRIIQATNEEQRQAIGLLCRETIISLAQVVFVEGVHTTEDGVKPSEADAKRMLEAYIVHELSGKSNENIRRHAKASLDLANDLTHRRTADFRLAAMCAEATNAVVNIIAIISGRRDPINSK